MSSPEEKAAQQGAAQAKPKCPKCGNERIRVHHNYCVICGNPLKENPGVIDFSQKQTRKETDLLAELNLPLTDSMRNTVKELEKRYSGKEIAEAIKTARLSGRNDFTYVRLILKNGVIDRE